MEGPDAGKEFALAEDSELIGRGRHATVRLTDRKLLDAHFILSRDGLLTASTPAAEVFIDGERVRRAEVKPGAKVKAGESAMEIERGA